jgi:hypothetical protein
MNKLLKLKRIHGKWNAEQGTILFISTPLRIRRRVTQRIHRRFLDKLDQQLIENGRMGTTTSIMRDQHEKQEINKTQNPSVVLFVAFLKRGYSKTNPG